MAYRLKRRRSLSSEVRRVIDTQLALAIGELHAIGDRHSDDVIHEARRHVKKVRAVLQLIRFTLGDEYYAANEQLRHANHLLAPIADGRSTIETIARVTKRYQTPAARRTLNAIRQSLLKRINQIDRKAEIDGLLPKVAVILRGEQKRLADWPLRVRSFRDLAPGLKRSIRRTQHGMHRAVAHPTMRNYRAWRRRVKTLWFQLRLLEDRCKNQLLTDQRRLEALDGCLDEYDNVVLLERILLSEELLPRQDVAAALHLLRRYQVRLRRRAISLGYRLSREDPRVFVHRIKSLWRLTKIADVVAEVKTPWRHAA